MTYKARLRVISDAMLCQQQNLVFFPAELLCTGLAQGRLMREVNKAYRPEGSN